MNWFEVLGWDQEKLEDMRYTAYSYIRQGSYDIALTFFDALSVLTPPTPYDLQTLAALHLQLGDALAALEHCDQALKKEPAHLTTQLNRAKALFALGYKKQGLQQAHALEQCDDPAIAAAATALILAYQS